MARRCELTGTAVLTGNNVSHAKNRSRRRYLPNLCKVTLLSDTLGRGIRLRVCASTLRTVDHKGGIDNFLLAAKDAELSPRARRVKRELTRKTATVAAAA